MKVKNQYNEDFNIGHFQGKQEKLNEVFLQQVDLLKDEKLVCPENVTIITTFTDKSLAYSVHQLERNNIKYINAAEDLNGEWSMPLKVGMIYNKLMDVKTEYVIILDSYDTVIYNFDNIIERFNNSKCGVLFNATKNNYPNCHIDKMPFRDYLGDFKYFNAGCCIGYTQDTLMFYKECVDFMNSDEYNNPYNSEQFVMRHIFSKYSEIMLMNYVPVKIDFNCSIFCCFGNGILYKIEEDMHNAYNMDTYILK